MKTIISLIIISFSLNSYPATQRAIFAGGNFWSAEEAFEKLKGVKKVQSGFTGGRELNPTYEEVTHGETTHVEAVEVTYNDSKITYQKLLEVFWKNIDPTDSQGQFCDRGDQYKTGIFYLNPTQKKLAVESLEQHQRSERFQNADVATFIRKAGPFYSADKKHQDYFKKHPVRYNFYKWTCGRKARLKEVWE